MAHRSPPLAQPDPDETIDEYFVRTASNIENTEANDKRIHPRMAFRRVFLSDMHLCTHASLTKQCVHFLNHIDTEYLFLVGDIIDCWSMDIENPSQIGKIFNKNLFKKIKLRALKSMRPYLSDHVKHEIFDKKFFDGDHLTTLQKIMRAVRKGTKTILLPGNHDDVFDILTGTKFGDNCSIQQECIVPIRRNGKEERYLVTHGDRFDQAVHGHRNISIKATQYYEKAIDFSFKLSQSEICRRFKLDKFGIVAQKIKDFLDRNTCDAAYQSALVNHLKDLNHDIVTRTGSHAKILAGSITAHTHRPGHTVVKANGHPLTFQLYNPGHWTQGYTTVHPDASPEAPSCTALVETLEGELKFVQWDEEKGIIPFVAPEKPATEPAHNIRAKQPGGRIRKALANVFSFVAK